MNPNKKYAISRSRRQIIDQVDEDNLLISSRISFDEVKISVPDLEVMTHLEWQSFQESLLITYKAEISSEASFNTRLEAVPIENIKNDDSLEYFISGEKLADDIATIYIKYKNRYFFIHDRTTVSTETIRLKVDLRISTDHVESLQQQLNSLKKANQTK